MPQKGFLSTTTHYIVDFYIPQRKLCIEVDGEHHTQEPQMSYDSVRDQYLSLVRGFKILRIPNAQAMKIDSGELSNMISLAA